MPQEAGRPSVQAGKAGKNGDRSPDQADSAALSNETTFPHEGVIDFVDNRVDPNTGTIRARGVFPNPDGLLTPGFYARVRIAGTGRYPWYPQAKVFNPAAFQEWGPVMDAVSQALQGEVAKA